MAHYIIVRNNEFVRGGPFKDAESARLALKPITDESTEVFEDLYVQVAGAHTPTYTNHQIYEFTALITVFDRDEELQTRYIWFDHGNGVSPKYDYRPKIISVLFSGVELLPAINDVVLSDVEAQARQHYLSQA